MHRLSYYYVFIIFLFYHTLYADFKNDSISDTTSPYSEVISWGNTHIINGPIKSIDVGFESFAILKENGHARIIGIYDSTYSIPEFISNIDTLSLGGGHLLVKTFDDDFIAFGPNEFGECDIPEDLKNVIFFHAGDGNFCSFAINDSGKLFAWGSNLTGNCNIPPNLGPVKKVSCKASHVLALLEDSIVVAWGNNDSGQLDIPDTLTKAIDISAGYGHSMALDINNRPITWGNPYFYKWYKQKGDSLPEDMHNIMKIAAGYDQSFVLTKEGKVKGWGYIPSTIDFSVFKNIKEIKSYSSTFLLSRNSKLTGYTNMDVDGSQKLQIYPGITGVIKISTGSNFTVALKNDGTVKAWGNNDYGQCDVPLNLTDVINISSGEYHSLALKKDGTIVAWGYNKNGQCNIPLEVKDVKNIYCGDYHSIALLVDGKVTAWGNNGSGQCNINQFSNISDIAGGLNFTKILTDDGIIHTFGNGETLVDYNNIIAISASGMNSLALTKGGKVLAYGNENGPYYLPPSLSNIKSVSGGFLALDEFGKVYRLVNRYTKNIAWSGDAIPTDLENVVQISNNGDNFSALSHAEYHDLKTIELLSDINNNSAEFSLVIKNIGNQRDTAMAYISIADHFSDSTFFYLDSGITDTIKFSPFQFKENGNYTITCSTTNEQDIYKFNNVLQSVINLSKDNNTTPKILNTQPNNVGNKGYTTITIEGENFTSQSEIRFQKEGQNDIVAKAFLNSINYNTSSQISSLFEFDNNEIGQWNIVVTNPDGQKTIYYKGLNISKANVDITSKLIGSESIRYKRKSSFKLKYTNNGNNDIISPLFLIKELDSIDLYHNNLNSSILELGSIKLNDGYSYYAFMLPPLRTRKNGEFNFSLIPNKMSPLDLEFQVVDGVSILGINQQIEINKNRAQPPLQKGDWFKFFPTVSVCKYIETEFPDLANSRPDFNKQPQTAWRQKQLSDSLFKYFPNEYPHDNCHIGNKRCQKDGDKYSGPAVMGYDKNGKQDKPNAYMKHFAAVISPDSIADFIQDGFHKRTTNSTINNNGNYLRYRRLYAMNNQKDYEKQITEKVNELEKIKQYLRYHPNELKFSMENYSKPTNCYGIMKYILKYEGPSKDVDWDDVLNNYLLHAHAFKIPVVNSKDPNNKTGTLGYGPENYIRSTETFHYTINFENVDTASASALDVFVIDTLSPHLDWSTFKMDSSSHDITKLDFDTTSGELKWNFLNIDLLPNKNPPEGEGWLSFTCKPKKELINNTQIQNNASIIFDFNEPIITNTVINTIDDIAPTSSIEELDSIQPLSKFTVSWDGSDDGSDIKHYEIYVASNEDTTFNLWLTTDKTSAEFSGSNNNTYKFYSIALDNVGLKEEVPEEFDAITTIKMPTGIKVNPNPYIPSKGHTFISFFGGGVPYSEIKIFNKAYELVHTLKEDDGENLLNWSGENSRGKRLSSGIYIFIAKEKNGNTTKGKFSIVF